MDWKEEDGGELRMYLVEGKQVDVQPKGGRLLIFLSGMVDHEVLPSHNHRVALTGWFS